jgi:beta-phosphoglucomutase family hydrolase
MQAVIFDLDGVVVDTTDQHHRSWQQAMAEQGYSVSNSEFCDFFGMRNEEIVQRLLGNDVTAEQISAIAGRKEEIYRRLVHQSLAPVLGLMPLLADLRAHGFRLALGTSAPPENIALIFDELQLDDKFDAVVGGADVTRGKPHPDVFLLAAERLAVPPQCCVVIEDAVAGIEAARAAGMHSIAVTSTNSREKLLAAGADRVVDSLAELDATAIARLLAQRSTLHVQRRTVR